MLSFFCFFSKCLRNCGRCLVLLYIVKTLINGSRYRRKIHVFPSFCSPNCSSIYTILLIISYPETCFNLHVLWSQYDKHTHNVPVDLCKFYLAFFFFIELQDHFPTATFVVGICVSTVVVSAFLWITQRRKVKKH